MHNGQYSAEEILYFVKKNVKELFVPKTRKINNKPLSDDILLSSNDIGVFKPLRIPNNTSTDIQLDNGGAYLMLYIGGSGQKDILLTLVGTTGNTTTSQVLSASSLTVTDGTGTGKVTVKQTTGSARYIYAATLNDANDAYVV